MKKIFRLGIVTLLSLGLMSCGGNEEVKNTDLGYYGDVSISEDSGEEYTEVNNIGYINEIIFEVNPNNHFKTNFFEENIYGVEEENITKEEEIHNISRVIKDNRLNGTSSMKEIYENNKGVFAQGRTADIVQSLSVSEQYINEYGTFVVDNYVNEFAESSVIPQLTKYLNDNWLDETNKINMEEKDYVLEKDFQNLNIKERFQEFLKKCNIKIEGINIKENEDEAFTYGYSDGSEFACTSISYRGFIMAIKIEAELNYFINEKPYTRDIAFELSYSLKEDLRLGEEQREYSIDDFELSDIKVRLK